MRHTATQALPAQHEDNTASNTILQLASALRKSFHAVGVALVADCTHCSVLHHRHSNIDYAVGVTSEVSHKCSEVPEGAVLT
jgi:hypothetical protein